MFVQHDRIVIISGRFVVLYSSDFKWLLIPNINNGRLRWFGELPTLLALIRTFRTGVLCSTTRFFMAGRLLPAIRARSAVSTDMDSERPTPTQRWWRDTFRRPFLSGSKPKRCATVITRSVFDRQWCTYPPKWIRTENGNVSQPYSLPLVGPRGRGPNLWELKFSKKRSQTLFSLKTLNLIFMPELIGVDRVQLHNSQLPVALDCASVRKTSRVSWRLHIGCFNLTAPGSSPDALGLLSL